MRRLLACTLVAACAALAAVPAGATSPEPEALSWSAVSRFGGDADGDGRLDPPVPSWLAGLDVFPVRVRPGAEICAGLDHARWLVDGRRPARVEVEPGEDCRILVAVRGEGRHTIEASGGGRSERADFVVDERLVVALGDSVASGEGNPDRTRGWLDPPCHRSAAAGFQQAAAHLSQRTRRWTTFVSLACSGAEVQEGLLRPYAGIAPDPRVGSYPPQVWRLARIARGRAAGDGGGAVDAVLLSVGANDVRFSAIVKACAAPGDCREGRREQIGSNLNRLQDSYDVLGARLRRTVPGAPVLITEYFDPTHDEDGEPCGQSVAFTTRAEARWAYEGLLRPLNLEIAAAAVRNRWHLVDGIASDFRRHGYCAGEAGWVRRLTGSLFSQRDVWGTLHPSLPGHTAIAKRVAPPLAQVLGRTVPPWPAAAEESGPSDEWVGVFVAAVLLVLAIPLALTLAAYPIAVLTTIAGGLLALVVLLVALVAILALRLLRLLRPTTRDPCPAERASPDLSTVRAPATPQQFFLLGGGVAVALGLTALFAGVAGSGILWVRFWSARMPPDQSVDAIARSELVATGAQALSLFVALGLLAMGVAWIVDGKGQWVRSTRRGLVAIGLVEMLVAILIGDFSRDQGLMLFAGLVAAALLVHFLVDRALALASPDRSVGLPEMPDPRLAALLRSLGRDVRQRPWVLLRGLPLLLLLVAIVRSFSAETDDRLLFVLAPFAIAAVLFVAPGGSAARGVAHGGRLNEAERRSLTLPRIALALAGLICILALVVRDEAWLAATAAVATLLGLFCLAVAKASGQRFAPYGLAVLISVPIFGAAASVTRGIAYPELQPAAAVLIDGSPLCGAYVGESDGRLWMARLLLDERGDVNRPRRGDIFSIDSDRVAERMLGPLTPVGRVEARAAGLREALLDARGDGDVGKRWPTCTPPEEPVTRSQRSSGWRRDLAERYQPELVVDRRDGFWPIPVKTLFSMQDRRAAICRQVAPGGDNCLRLTTQGEFPWTGGEGESLEYPPAEGDGEGQHELMTEALGSADPDRTAAAYYLVSGGGSPNRPVTIQYWFFYPYNYQRVRGIVNGGVHEGDFESVGVLLSAKTRQPRYLWLNRHDREGRIFPWEDRSVEIVDGHPIVHAARGSHAAYERCGRQARPVPGKGALDDNATCAEKFQLHLLPEAMPLTDLSRVAWGCWHGRFGHVRGTRASEGGHRIADGPLGPLWQQKFDGRTWEPCRGIEDPGGREGQGEEVIEEAEGVPALLRKRAGRLDPLVDECGDWHSPQPTGTYMVACDPKALRLYLAAGLERRRTDGVQILASQEKAGEGGGVVPALRRDPRGDYLGDWRLTSAGDAVVSVFATCPRGGAIVGASFRRVTLKPGRTLRLRDRHLGGQWGLVGGDGSVVARATPFVTRPDLGELRREPAAPNREVACGGG